METKKFKCKVCGYIHEGDAAPAECPVCKAPASEFVEITSNKKGFSTNSNGYTLIYMVVIIVVVSLLLSITSGVLKGRQMDNVKLDKKKQILSSLPSVDFSADPAKSFEDLISKYLILDINGNVIKELDPVKDFDYKVLEGQEFPMYVATIDGATKYIIPMRGVGLWGALWGYIALNDDRNTVYGVFFSHASETPGLGAEIVTPMFRDPFQGKHLLNDNGEFVSIAVMKVGQHAVGKEQVDAISGGTITSAGVENMLATSLENYKTFLEAGRNSNNAANAEIKDNTLKSDMVEPENIGD